MPMSPEEWESLCRRCGRCCFEKIETGDGTVWITDQPCRYLDGATRRCKVYPRRVQVCPDCLILTEELVGRAFWLPEDCGYVEHYRRLHGRWPDLGPDSDQVRRNRIRFSFEAKRRSEK